MNIHARLAAKTEPACKEPEGRCLYETYLRAESGDAAVLSSYENHDHRLSRWYE